MRRHFINYQPREAHSLQEEVNKLGFRAYEAWGNEFVASQHRHFQPALVVNLTTHRNYNDQRLLHLADEMWLSLIKFLPLHLRVLSGLRENLILRAHLHQALLTDKQLTSEQIREAIGFIKGFWARHGNPLLQDIRPPESPNVFGYICEKNEGTSQIYKTYCPKKSEECLKRKGKLPACPYKLI